MDTGSPRIADDSLPRARASSFSCRIGPAAAQRGTGEAVDLALVLAVDASGSVDQVRFELQKQGYVAAFRHPRVMAAISVRTDAVDRRDHDAVDRAGAAGDRGAVDQDLRPGLGQRVRRQIAAAPRALFGGGTSISGAIDTGMALLFDNPYRATRRVIDISGDGSNNRGRLVNQARDEAVRAGVGINGLPILALDRSSTAITSRT